MLSNELRTLELKAFRSTFQDGLWDLFLGLIIFSGAVSSAFPHLGISRFWSYSLFLVAFAVFFLGKMYITRPRLGTVRFGAERKAMQNKLTILIGLLVVITAAIWLLITQNLMPNTSLTGASLYLKRLSFGVLFFLLPFGILGLAWNQPRLIVFGVLTAVGESLYPYIDAPWNGIICFGIPGLLFIGIGLVLLFTFIRTHPLAEKE